MSSYYKDRHKIICVQPDNRILMSVSVDYIQVHGFINFFGPQRFGRACDPANLGQSVVNNQSEVDVSRPQLYEAPAVGRAILKQDLVRFSA